MSKYVKVEDIIGYINTGNRGNCDYFIVDRIEELCNSDKVIDLANHDKQVRDEVIIETLESVIKMIADFGYEDLTSVVLRENIKVRIAQLKGEQNDI